MSLGLEVFALALTLAGGAVTDPVPAIGSRVRVDFMLGTMQPGYLQQRAASRVGVLRDVDSTSIRLEVSPQETHSITFGDIERIEVSRGRTPRQGLLRGAFYGAAIGLALGTLFHSVQYDGMDPDRNTTGLAVVAGFSAGGGVIGGLAGANLHGEEWRPVPVRSLWEHP